MKKLILTGAFAALGALVLGSAAALTVNGGSVQAGSDVGLACDADGVDVAYGTSWNGTEFVIDDVTVSGIDAGCVGSALDVVLTDGGLEVGNGTIASIAAASETVTIGVPPAAEDVDDVHVAIH